MAAGPGRCSAAKDNSHSTSEGIRLTSQNSGSTGNTVVTAASTHGVRLCIGGRGQQVLGDPRFCRARHCVSGSYGPERENGEKASLGNGRRRPHERPKVSETSTDVLTPLDVENEFRIPRSSQKKGRAKGSFVPYFRVGLSMAK